MHNGDSTFEVLLCAWGYCGDEVKHFFVLKCRWGFNFCYFLVLFGYFLVFLCLVVLSGTVQMRSCRFFCSGADGALTFEVHLGTFGVLFDTWEVLLDTAEMRWSRFFAPVQMGL